MQVVAKDVIQTKRNGRLARGLLLLGLAVGVGWPAAARADKLDEVLLKKANTVMKMLESRQYETVGTIKFQVQKGNRKPSFDVGLLNANMATRLEYALVLVNSDKKPINIAHNCSQEAVKVLDKKTTELSDEVRKTLFGLDYPLAWGKTSMKVDAFLTGLVRIDDDFKKTTVRLQLFDRKENTVKDLLQFNVDTDRSILSDSGEVFSLAKRGGLIAKRGDQLDEEAIQDVVERNKGNAQKNPDSAENVIDLDVLYDGEKQMVTTDATGMKRIADPKEGKKVAFKVRNKTKDKLGMVLRVNGLNTLNNEGPDKQIDQCSRWVLDPDTSYTIDGFYQGNVKRPFEVKSPAGLIALDPTKLGLIEVAVFQKGEEDDQDNLGSRINLRGLSANLARPGTSEEMKEVVRKASKSEPVSRGLIMPGAAQANQNLAQVDFGKAIYVGSLTIRYYP